jgi:hypothetical protein
MLGIVLPWQLPTLKQRFSWKNKPTEMKAVCITAFLMAATIVSCNKLRRMYLKEGGGESKEKALHYYYCKY